MVMSECAVGLTQRHQPFPARCAGGDEHTHELFRTQKKTGDLQGFQAVQSIKAIGSQALDPVVVQVPVDKTEIVSGGAS